MKRSEAFPTKFLSKDDIHVPTVGIVEQVINETLGQGDDQEIKPVMYFSSGIPKPMVINNTNWMNVEVLYGNESDDWTGKPIEVWVDPSVAFGGKRIGGLRLRAPAGQLQPAQVAPAADLATGEQWEMFYSLAGTLDGKDITVPEPPETITIQGMLKVLASLRAKLAPKHSEAEINQELGYTEIAPTSLTLEEANDVLNSEGVRYGDIETEKLSLMVNSLLKVKSPTSEQGKKLLAIRTILAARSLKEKVEQPV